MITMEKEKTSKKKHVVKGTLISFSLTFLLTLAIVTMMTFLAAMFSGINYGSFSIKIYINNFYEAWPEFIMFVFAFPISVIGYFLAMQYFLQMEGRGIRKDAIGIIVGSIIMTIAVFFIFYSFDVTNWNFWIGIGLFITGAIVFIIDTIYLKCKK